MPRERPSSSRGKAPGHAPPSFTQRPSIVTSRSFKRLRIALLDDHPVVRTGLIVRLSSEMHLELTGVHGCSQALIDGLRAQPVDIVLVDYVLGPRQLAGASLIQALRSKFPATRVLVFSAHPDPARVSQALRAGASGFVGKRQPMHELINAIDVVARGSVYVGTGTASDDTAQRDAQADIGSALSTRERDVIRCYLEGMTVSEIALKFNRSIKTISSQKASAFRKLGVSSNNDLFKLRDHLDAV